MKIFIIDDDKFFSSILMKQLEMNGLHDLHQFHSLSAALRKLNHAPDVILLDHFIQGTLGMDFIPVIKNNLPKTKIIYMSSQTDMSVLALSRQIGANKYFRKDQHLIEHLLNEIHSSDTKSNVPTTNVLHKLKSLVVKSNRIRILIADDDKLHNVFLRYKLSKVKNFEIIIHDDLNTLYEDLKTTPEVLILEHQFLEFTAQEIIKKSRELSPSTRIIILSSQTELKVGLDLFELGIDDYVVKNKDWQENLLYSIEKLVLKRHWQD